MRASVLALVVIAGCATSTTDVATAKHAVYRGGPRDLLALAEQAAGDNHYKVLAADEEHLAYETESRFYSPEGDLQSPGAEGFVNLDYHSVKVAFLVQVHEIGNDQYMITVTPRTFQYIKTPQLRELAPDDPNLPPWVLGRADALWVSIYERAQGYAIMAPPTGPPPAESPPSGSRGGAPPPTPVPTGPPGAQP